MDFNEVGHGRVKWLRIDKELVLLAFAGGLFSVYRQVCIMNGIF
jgi:hypothetical protein